MGTPHYKEIPDHWKYPMGPYHQAPPEFGGEWWVVNPFTTSEPGFAFWPWHGEKYTPPEQKTKVKTFP